MAPYDSTIRTFAWSPETIRPIDPGTVETGGDLPNRARPLGARGLRPITGAGRENRFRLWLGHRIRRGVLVREFQGEPISSHVHSKSEVALPEHLADTAEDSRAWHEVLESLTRYDMLTVKWTWILSMRDRLT